MIYEKNNYIVWIFVSIIIAALLYVVGGLMLRQSNKSFVFTVIVNVADCSREHHRLPNDYEELKKWFQEQGDKDAGVKIEGMKKLLLFNWSVPIDQLKLTDTPIKVIAPDIKSIEPTLNQRFMMFLKG